MEPIKVLGLVRLGLLILGSVALVMLTIQGIRNTCSLWTVNDFIEGRCDRFIGFDLGPRMDREK